MYSLYVSAVNLDKDKILLFGKEVNGLLQTDVTVPLYQKALKKDLDVDIVKLLQTVLPDSREHEEKDVVRLDLLLC